MNAPEKILCQIIRLMVAIILTSVAVIAQSNQKEDAKIAEKVKIAFEQLAKQNFKPLQELKPFGSKLVPYLKPYLTGSDLSIRYVALSLLKNVKEPEYISVFLTALRDPDIHTSRTVAQYLYDNFDHQTLAQNAAVGDALRQSAVDGNTSLATIILLGYFPGRETETTLLSIRNAKDLRYWTANPEIWFGAEISATVPVYLSLYRVNNQKYYEPLTRFLRKASPGEIEFLLNVLNFVDDTELLKLIFQKGVANRKTLESEQVIDGLPLGNEMRLVDMTVNEFAKKLNLNLGFEQEETRYSPRKIFLAQQKINARLAAPKP